MDPYFVESSILSTACAVAITAKPSRRGEKFMEQPPFPKFTCQKLTDIEKDRVTAAQISPLVTDLSGNKEKPAEITSETGRDKALMMSPSVIGDSSPEVTALLSLGEQHAKDSDEAEEKEVNSPQLVIPEFI